MDRDSGSLGGKHGDLLADATEPVDLLPPPERSPIRLRCLASSVLDIPGAPCPGHAAPGKGAEPASRKARAAEIARRLEEPRKRGVDIAERAECGSSDEGQLLEDSTGTSP